MAKAPIVAGKKIGYVLAVCLLAGVGFTMLLKHDVIAKQLDDWYLLRRPERFTQLYFSDYQQLPTTVAPNATRPISFAVRNLEHRRTTYRYRLLAHGAGQDSGQLLHEGSFELDHNGLITLSESVTIPPLDDRVYLEVQLQYQGIVLGKTQATAQALSIGHWINLEKNADAEELR
jgi:hypothetical protein